MERNKKEWKARGRRTREREKTSNSLVSSLLQPELYSTFHIPRLLIPRSSTFRRSSLLLEKLLGNGDERVASKLNLILLVPDERRRNHVGVAVSTEEIRVGRVSVGVVLRERT